jgi:histone H3/H4
MTKLLVLIKQKRVTDATLNEDLVRAFLDKIQYASHRPSGPVFLLIQKFHDRSISLAELAHGFYNLSKKPEYETITAEFKEIVQKGQYVPLLSALKKPAAVPNLATVDSSAAIAKASAAVPNLATVDSSAAIAKASSAIPELTLDQLKKKYDELERQRLELIKKKAEADALAKNKTLSLDDTVKLYKRLFKNFTTAEQFKKENITPDTFRWDAFAELIKDAYNEHKVDDYFGSFSTALTNLLEDVAEKAYDTARNAMRSAAEHFFKFIAPGYFYVPGMSQTNRMLRFIGSIKVSSEAEQTFISQFVKKYREHANAFAKPLSTIIGELNTIFPSMGYLPGFNEKLMEAFIDNLKNDNTRRVELDYFLTTTIVHFGQKFIKKLGSEFLLSKILMDTGTPETLIVKNPPTDDMFYLYDYGEAVTPPYTLKRHLNKLEIANLFQLLKPQVKQGALDKATQINLFKQMIDTVAYDYYGDRVKPFISDPAAINNFDVESLFVAFKGSYSNLGNFFGILHSGTKVKEITDFMRSFVKANEKDIRDQLTTAIENNDLTLSSFYDSSFLKIMETDFYILDFRLPAVLKKIREAIKGKALEPKKTYNYLVKNNVVSTYEDFFNICFSDYIHTNLFSADLLASFIREFEKSFVDFYLKRFNTTLQKEFVAVLDSYGGTGNKALFVVKDPPDDDYLYIGFQKLKKIEKIREVVEALNSIGLVKVRPNDPLKKEPQELLMNILNSLDLFSNSYSAAELKQVLSDLGISGEKELSHILNVRDVPSELTAFLRGFGTSPYDGSNDRLSQLFLSYIGVICSTLLDPSTNFFAKALRALVLSEYVDSATRKMMIEAAGTSLEEHTLQVRVFNLKVSDLARNSPTFVKNELFQIYETASSLSEYDLATILPLGFIPKSDNLIQFLSSRGAPDMGLRDKSIRERLLKEIPGLYKDIVSAIRSEDISFVDPRNSRGKFLMFVTEDMFLKEFPEKKQTIIDNIIFGTIRDYTTYFNEEFLTFIMKDVCDVVLGDDSKTLMPKNAREFLRSIGDDELKKLSASGGALAKIVNLVSHAHANEKDVSAFVRVALEGLLENQYFIKNLRVHKDLFVKVFEDLEETMENARKSGWKKETREQMYEKFSTIVVEYQEIDEPTVRQIFNSLNTKCKKKITQKLLGSSFIEGARESLMKSPISPLEEIDHKRMVEIFKFNKIDVPSIDMRTYKTYNDIMSLKTRMQTLKPQGIVLAENTPATLKRKSIELDAYNKYKHGGASIEILKEFNVDLDIFREGYKKFLDEKPDTKIMDPVFHGTGPVAASMILRYGFTIVSRTDGGVTGRALGDGIYFSNVIDKVANYIEDKGMVQRKTMFGRRGYIFQMKAALGNIGEDYEMAGPGSRKFTNFISPEWCVYKPNQQLLVYKAYLIELQSKSWMDAARKQVLTEREHNILKIGSFKEFLKESVIPKYEFTTTYCFIDGQIPVNEDSTVDFEDFDPTVFGDHVMLEIGQNGPELVIHHNEDESELYMIRYGDDILKDEKAKDHYFKLLKGETAQ